VEVIEISMDLERDPPLAYMVMELLSGASLAELLERGGALDPKTTVRLGKQIACAMAAVHEAGMLHRDLKPENVFVVQQSDNGRLVKLVDFGAVKNLADEPVNELTTPGTAIGTPLYMAPEQITDQPVDQRTDIYSLGVLLYKMLTGRVPFQARTYGELMLQLVTDPPPPINDSRGGGEGPEGAVPEALEAVVMRCLEKDPGDRFENMGALEQALSESLGAKLRRRRVVSTSGTIEPLEFQRPGADGNRVTPSRIAHGRRSRQTARVMALSEMAAPGDELKQRVRPWQVAMVAGAFLISGVFFYLQSRAQPVSTEEEEETVEEPAPYPMVVTFPVRVEQAKPKSRPPPASAPAVPAPDAKVVSRRTVHRRKKPRRRKVRRSRRKPTPTRRPASTRSRTRTSTKRRSSTRKTNKGGRLLEPRFD
jgi:serine/threonine protein kinase